MITYISYVVGCVFALTGVGLGLRAVDHLRKDIDGLEQRIEMLEDDAQ